MTGTWTHQEEGSDDKSPSLRAASAPGARVDVPLADAMVTSIGDFHGRTVCVTGGASGIGLAVVTDLAARGATVYVVDRPRERAAAAASTLPAGAVYLEADVRELDQLISARELVEVDGVTVDTLVVAAGINVRAPLTEVADADIRAILDTNLYGAIATMRAFAPMLIGHDDARVILVGSVIDTHGMVNRATYAASKAGIAGLVKSLAVEWGSHRIRVNAVAPGIIATPLLEGYLTDELRALTEANTPLGRLGRAEDVANVVRFLASDAASFVSGQVIGIDGGLAAGINWW